MPEGDTIWRSARRLSAALAGAEVVRVSAPRWAGRLPSAGERVESVESVGKHLLIAFSGGLTLSTHLRMSGSWHLYRPGERWQKSRSAVRALVETADWQAVCFLAPDVRFDPTPGGPVASGPRLTVTAHLGPDLCRPDADLDECVRRFALVDPDLTIAETLLDQRVCCGVGNVFKSEVCWALEMDPFTPTSAVTALDRRRLVEVAATQLRANLDQGRRTTVPGGLAVYGRTGRPCRRCGSRIVSAAHGEQARRTYWCPDCQTRETSS